MSYLAPVSLLLVCCKPSIDQLHAHVLQADVIPVCRELGIGIVCYSPLGRGFLTGQIKSYDDIPDVSCTGWVTPIMVSILQCHDWRFIDAH
jgi:diketogulonate reductase-like aldo/keto reductase